MHLGTADRDPETACWQVFFNPESEEWARQELFQDGQSPIIPDLIREWGIEWCPEEIEPDVETRLFGLRRQFREAGPQRLWDPVGPRVESPTDLHPDAPVSAVPYGRAAYLEPLGTLLKQIREQQGLSIEAVLHRATRTKPPLTAADIVWLEAGEGGDVGNLLNYARALDYAIAVLPQVGAIELQTDDPWREFRRSR
jgi:hypothetical protein